LPEWRAFLTAKFDLLFWRTKLDEMLHQLESDDSELMNNVRVRLIIDKGIAAYLCVKIRKENDYPEKSEQIGKKLNALLCDGMMLHGNGRNFALLPPYASKQLAVNFLKEHMSITSHDTVFGIGDSNSDLPFMSDSDFLIIPQRSQIIEKGMNINIETKEMNPKQINTPFSGSYSENDCLFLLKKITPEFYTVEDKERLIQSGQLHYSQMVSQESKPTAEYEELFLSLTAEYKQQLADEVLRLSYLIATKIKQKVCVVSLARAGTPIGVLVNRGINQYSEFGSCHYSISIVRDKGIDENALDYLILEQGIAPESIVFIDGWTAKGVITKELKQAIQRYNQSRNVNISDALYVISDIGGTADVSVTLEDYTIPSALMNSTVSGLISRSVINDQIGKDDFHGCITYQHLEKYDYSNWFIDEVSDCFSSDSFQRCNTVDDGERELRYTQTQKYLTQLMSQFDVSDINRIKPGIAEATRVMLRRVPDVLIISDKSNANIKHLLRIAHEKNIGVVEIADMPFGACALIRDVT